MAFLKESIAPAGIRLGPKEASRPSRSGELSGCRGKKSAIGIRGVVTHSPLPHHRMCGAAYGGSEGYAANAQEERLQRVVLLGAGGLCDVLDMAALTRYELVRKSLFLKT